MTKYTIPDKYLSPIDEEVAYVEVYFDRRQQSYMVSLRTVEGYQIGAAQWIGMGGGGKHIAAMTANEWSQEFGVPVVRG